MNIHQIPTLNSLDDIYTAYIFSSNADPDKSSLYFQDELHGSGVTIFKYYDQSACEYECMLNETARICSCIPFDVMRPQQVHTYQSCWNIYFDIA